MVRLTARRVLLNEVKRTAARGAHLPWCTSLRVGCC